MPDFLKGQVTEKEYEEVMEDMALWFAECKIKEAQEKNGGNV